MVSSISPFTPFSVPTATTDSTGTASTTITLNQPAQNLPVTSTFATDSIYLGSSEMKKTQQIVLAGTVAGNADGSGGATVKWAIRREGRKATEE